MVGLSPSCYPTLATTPLPSTCCCLPTAAYYILHYLFAALQARLLALATLNELRSGGDAAGTWHRMLPLWRRRCVFADAVRYGLWRRTTEIRSPHPLALHAYPLLLLSHHLHHIAGAMWHFRVAVVHLPGPSLCRNSIPGPISWFEPAIAAWRRWRKLLLRA